ncbi:toxic anion resistance protein [Peptostreptococcaceae bacterium AGR-M142]
MSDIIDLNKDDRSIVEIEQDVTNEIKASKEIEVLANQVDLSNVENVMSFGSETANEISKFADRILDNIKSTNIESSSSLLLELNKIMDKFDADDFAEKKPSLLSKIFNKTKNSIEQLFNKYNTMGTQMDSVYVKLKEYENEIKKSNNTLEEMLVKNMEYFKVLQKHILAGDLLVQRIDNEIQSLNSSTDELKDIKLQRANEVKDIIGQRVFDLELAKNVSLQTMPQIKVIQKGNYNLVRKINSAFIVTIPVFKQSLIQAITLKRQKNQADALAALDQKTNELLMKNAQNTAMQSKTIAELSSGSSIKIETLTKTWETITKGIEETKQIEEKARQERIDGTNKLLEIQNDFKEKFKH